MAFAGKKNMCLLGLSPKSDEPSFVTLSTEATIDFFGAVSFQEGSGFCACNDPAANSSRRIKRVILPPLQIRVFVR
jgi:hypothetical protein